MGASRREFDLTGAPRLTPWGPGLIRAVVIALAAVIGGLTIGISVYNEITGRVRGIPSPVGLVLIGAAVLFVGLFVTIFFGMGHGAHRCDWEADGFTLRYRSGRTRSFRWGDPKLRIEISEIHYEDKVEYDLTTRMPWHNDVTAEVYQAILVEARQRGLAVRTKVQGSPAERLITNRIQAEASPRS